MTQVFILGSLHFNQDGADFFTESSQHQLRILNDKLVEFAPDVVCVEVPSQEQDTLDAIYASLPIDVFSDYETMRNDSSTYQDEAVQIGMRLGKTLDFGKIYAIDETLDLPAFDIPDALKPSFEQHMQFLMDEKNAPTSGYGTLYDRILFTNTEEWSYHHHQLYIELNEVGAGQTHEGANMLGEWYKRNLRIFANLQKLCKKYKRIFVIYGAGHLTS